MKIQRFDAKDQYQILAILEYEKIPAEGVYEGDTWVVKNFGIIKGFFTLRLDGKFPMLQHFAIHRHFKTDIKLIYFLMRQARKRAKDLGFKHLVYQAPKDKPKVAQLLGFYTRKRPYAETNKAWWFITKV